MATRPRRIWNWHWFPTGSGALKQTGGVPLAIVGPPTGVPSAVNILVITVPVVPPCSQATAKPPPVNGTTRAASKPPLSPTDVGAPMGVPSLEYRWNEIVLLEVARPPGCTDTSPKPPPANAAAAASTGCCGPAWIAPTGLPNTSNACDRTPRSDASVHTITNPPFGRGSTYVGRSGEGLEPCRQKLGPRIALLASSRS